MSFVVKKFDVWKRRLEARFRPWYIYRTAVRSCHHVIPSTVRQRHRNRTDDYYHSVWIRESTKLQHACFSQDQGVCEGAKVIEIYAETV